MCGQWQPIDTLLHTRVFGDAHVSIRTGAARRTYCHHRIVVASSSSSGACGETYVDTAVHTCILVILPNPPFRKPIDQTVLREERFHRGV